MIISIHAPARGATMMSALFLSVKSHFNPRSRERSDVSWIRQKRTLDSISIHAPARGATVLLLLSRWLRVFQSTLPREERPLHHSTVLVVIDFNPRSRERSDGFRLINGFKKVISIHAPARGATNKSNYVAYASQFQSTLPREERRFDCFLNVREL